MTVGFPENSWRNALRYSWRNSRKEFANKLFNDFQLEFLKEIPMEIQDAFYMELLKELPKTHLKKIPDETPSGVLQRIPGGIADGTPNKHFWRNCLKGIPRSIFEGTSGGISQEIQESIYILKLMSWCYFSSGKQGARGVFVIKDNETSK